MDRNEITEIKLIIRSLLLSCTEKITINQLCADYRDLNGKDLPYQDFGYQKPIDFVKTMSDVVRMEWIPSMNDFGLSAIADSTTQHIQNMVARQKRKRKSKRKKTGVVVRPQIHAKSRTSLSDLTFASDSTESSEMQNNTVKTATVSIADLQEERPNQKNPIFANDSTESFETQDNTIKTATVSSVNLQEVKPNQKETFTWDSESTRLLLQCMFDVNGDFQKCKGTNSKLWKNIALKMQQIGGYDVTDNICNKKWNKLLNTYQKFKNSSTKKDAHWEYFNRIDALLKFKGSVSSDKQNLTKSLSETSQNSTTSAEPIPTTSKLKNESAKQTEDNIGLYLLEYLKKKEENEQIRWKEYKELQKEKIKAINNVANILLQYKKSEF